MQGLQRYAERSARALCGVPGPCVRRPAPADVGLLGLVKVQPVCQQPVL